MILMQKGLKGEKKIICPDCQKEISLSKVGVQVGDILECVSCACEVEILSLSPFKYAELFEEK